MNLQNEQPNRQHEYSNVLFHIERPNFQTVLSTLHLQIELQNVSNKL